MHLAAFAAAEGGLFAEQGLDVELVPAASAPDYSLSGFTTRVKAVAAGNADFALTSVVYLLAAQTETAGRLPVRFVATCHQRNPIVGVVREDSGLRAPQDLPGARAARWSMPWYAQEYAGALSHMGLGAPEIVDTPGDLDRALGAGEIDVIPTWMDDTTHTWMQDMMLYHLGSGFGVRAIPLDIPVYSTGLVAADRLPLEVVCGMRDAFAAGHELQREQPELGLDAFRRHFPRVSEEHARANWRLYEPYAFDGVPSTSMNAERWQDTIAYAAEAHGLSTIPPERMYRPEFLAPALTARP
ncbi:MAG: ABC transporter substrate-binding protein [Solirubrobacteraceae bacterium]